MTQPLDRTCKITAKGAIDASAGEFWAENAFDMPAQRQNLSAFEQNKVYLSQGGERFVDLSNESGAGIDSDSRSVVAADFNGDGSPDLLVGSVGGGPLRLFLNQIPRDMHRVRIELVGTESNRSGIGTRIVAHVDGRQIVRDVFPANGFMGQSPSDVILGVGTAELIDQLQIRWPSGHTESFPKVPVDCRISVTEGNDKLDVVRELSASIRGE